MSDLQSFAFFLGHQTENPAALWKFVEQVHRDWSRRSKRPARGRSLGLLSTGVDYGTNWTALGSGVSGVGDLASTGTELYVGSAFSTAGGKPSTNIALWHIPHSLNISRSGNSTALSWSATGSNFTLEASSNISSSTWTNVSPTPIRSGDQLIVSNSISSSNQFFRLRRY